MFAVERRRLSRVEVTSGQSRSILGFVEPEAQVKCVRSFLEPVCADQKSKRNVLRAQPYEKQLYAVCAQAAILRPDRRAFAYWHRFGARTLTCTIRVFTSPTILLLGWPVPHPHLVETNFIH
jgi:hypothetical protein